MAIEISSTLITAGHIILGKLVPKSIVLQCTEKTIFVVARPLLFFVRLLRPFIALMNGLGNAFVRVLSLQATSEQANMHSIEELEMLVLDVQEATFLRQVFDFGDKTVQQVMVTLEDLVSWASIGCESEHWISVGSYGSMWSAAKE